jgi:hypothetical protein
MMRRPASCSEPETATCTFVRPLRNGTDSVTALTLAGLGLLVSQFGGRSLTPHLCRQPSMTGRLLRLTGGKGPQGEFLMYMHTSGKLQWPSTVFDSTGTPAEYLSNVAVHDLSSRTGLLQEHDTSSTSKFLEPGR